MRYLSLAFMILTCVLIGLRNLSKRKYSMNEKKIPYRELLFFTDWMNSKIFRARSVMRPTTAICPFVKKKERLKLTNYKYLN